MRAGEGAALALGIVDGLVGLGDGAEEFENLAVGFADVFVEGHGGIVAGSGTGLQTGVGAEGVFDPIDQYLAVAPRCANATIEPSYSV